MLLPGAFTLERSNKLIVGSDERSSKVARYIVMAESENSGYTSVPEFPWATVIVAVALTLPVVVLKYRRTPIVS